jgi:hypothetical protein
LFSLKKLRKHLNKLVFLKNSTNISLPKKIPVRRRFYARQDYKKNKRCLTFQGKVKATVKRNRLFKWVILTVKLWLWVRIGKDKGWVKQGAKRVNF